jgi:hypothetical protein
MSSSPAYYLSRRVLRNLIEGTAGSIWATTISYNLDHLLLPFV